MLASTCRTKVAIARTLTGRLIILAAIIAIGLLGWQTLYPVAPAPGGPDGIEVPTVARPAAVLAKPSSFSATFALENGDKVTLDYIDADNYRFSSQSGALQTYVLGGGIYLYAKADAAQPERAWYYGAIAPQTVRSLEKPEVRLRPTTVPARGVAAWGAIGPVADVDVPSAGSLGIAIEVTVAHHAQLADAQWSVANRLLSAMDMTLCGDAVQAVTQWWPTGLTGGGYAVVATSAGVRLDGPLRSFTAPLSLPGAFPITVHPFATLR